MDFPPDLLAHTFDAVICFSRERRVVSCNAAAERIFGISADDVIGRTCEELSTQAHFTAVMSRVRSTFESESTQQSASEIIRAENASASLDVKVVAMGAEVALITRDTSVDGHASGQVNQAFLASLSHQLRTPLTPLLMTAAALRADERLPSDAREQLGMMERNIAAVAQLIDRLGDGARISTAEPHREWESRDRDGRSEAQPRSPTARQSSAPLRLLLVEDHDSTLEVLSRLLKRAGHVVVTATTLAEALSAAKKGSFDLVISDLGLPDGTGTELMRIVRARYGLRGIALSGYGMDDDRARSRQAGFAAHLTKPVDFEQLQRALNEVVATEVSR